MGNKISVIKFLSQPISLSIPEEKNKAKLVPIVIRKRNHKIHISLKEERLF